MLSYSKETCFTGENIQKVYIPLRTKVKWTKTDMNANKNKTLLDNFDSILNFDIKIRYFDSLCVCGLLMM